MRGRPTQVQSEYEMQTLVQLLVADDTVSSREQLVLMLPGSVFWFALSDKKSTSTSTSPRSYRFIYDYLLFFGRLSIYKTFESSCKNPKTTNIVQFFYD